MSDILLFTLDDLGDRQGYVIAIFAIVLLAIGCVLLRDAYVWFIALGEQALEDEAAAEQQAGVAEATAEEADTAAPVINFRAGPHPAFGRRNREAA